MQSLTIHYSCYNFFFTHFTWCHSCIFRLTLFNELSIWSCHTHLRLWSMEYGRMQEIVRIFEGQNCCWCVGCLTFNFKCIEGLLQFDYYKLPLCSNFFFIEHFLFFWNILCVFSNLREKADLILFENRTFHHRQIHFTESYEGISQAWGLYYF